MARLPTVGGDTGTWGTVLNSYLTAAMTKHSLASSSAIGASSITLDVAPSAPESSLSLVAIAPYTTGCEIRRVSSITGTTVNLRSVCSFTRTNISFASGPKTITSVDTFLNPMSCPFYIGAKLKVSGSASNNGTFTITALSSDYKTITVSESVVTESAGASVTLKVDLNKAHSVGDVVLFLASKTLSVELFGPLSYGFSGDNSAVINDALRQAGSLEAGENSTRYAAIVELPPGPIPMESGITVSGATWLRGAGPGLTEFYWKNFIGGTFITLDNTNAQAKLSDFSAADGDGTASIGIDVLAGPWVFLQGGGVNTEIERVLLYGIDGNGVGSETNVVGIRLGGVENRLRDCWVAHVNGTGFHIAGTDNFLSNCTADSNTASGFAVTAENNKFVNCKAFGGGSLGNQPAFNVAGSGRNMFSSCEAQDYQGPGFHCQSVDNMFAACISDTCAQGTGASAPNRYGFYISGGCTAVGCVAMNRSGTPQLYGFKTGIDQSVYPIIAGCTSRLPGTAHVYPSSVGSIDVNNLRGQQSVAYSSPLTPDPYLGGSIVVGTLTNTITINPVSTAGLFNGMNLGFQFTQDGTGRAVTWDSQYKVASAISTTPNAVTRIQFEFDGTNFRETGRAVT